MKNDKRKKGQAVLEMAIFGSIILVLFGTLLSYMQRMNDQQYLQMGTFRRALEKACTYQGETSEGAGASVSFTYLENRRNVDTSGSFIKGNPQSLSASTSVFWAVPKSGGSPEDLVALRVNDDETQIDAERTVEDINSASSASFSEADIKQETGAAITNTRSSTLEDTVTTTFIDKDGEPIWEVTQGLYRDADGQYRYSSSQVGTQIERQRTWETGF